MRALRVASALLLSAPWPLQAQPLEPKVRRDARLHYDAGEDLMRVESFERAASEFRAAIELDPLMVLAHYQLGQAHMALKDYASAEQAYLACREAFRRLNDLGQREREEVARAARDEILELQRSLQRVRTGQIKIAAVEAEVVRIEQRIRLLQDSNLKGTEMLRPPAELALALGSAHFRQNELEDAEREYVAALKTDKRLGAAHNNLAVVYLLTGRVALAEGEIREAERAGFHVSPQLKADLQQRAGAAPLAPRP